MTLTDAEIAVAASLGMTPDDLEAARARVAAERPLTAEELRIARLCRISPEVCSRHKAELGAEREARQGTVTSALAEMTRDAEHARRQR